MSVTSVMYMKDEVSIATAGAVDRYARGYFNSLEILCTTYLYIDSYFNLLIVYFVSVL